METKGKDETTIEDDKMVQKISVEEFIKKNRISRWAAWIFMKDLLDDEYSEKELEKKYKKFLKEKPAKEVKK